MSSMRRGTPHRWVMVVAVAAAGLVVLQSSLLAAGRIVGFRAFDGRTLSAFVVDAATRPAPAVVLVPMLGRPKNDWEIVAQRLADANITALAIDLPGQYAPSSSWSTDVQAAVSFLASRPEVRPDAIGVAGASLGANLAALAAAADPRIRSLALISPSLEYRGIRIEAAMRTYGVRPALLMASLQDPYAARSVRDLADDPPGLREVRWAETAAHGSLLLAFEPDLIGSLVDWFQRTLR